MTTTLAIGHLLRAGTTGFVIGCKATNLDAPVFGALVRAPLETGYSVYGLIHDIHIDDDGLVRQLVTAEGIEDEVLADNRLNRNVPIEIGVLAVGYQSNGSIRHLLPPRPPLSLDKIFLCAPEEVCAFTSAGRFGYFRHILRAVELPVAELLAAHLQQASRDHRARGDDGWLGAATQELITLLRDDYPTLMSVLSAVGEVE